MHDQPKMIFVRETPVESIKRDAGTTAAALALILPGVLLGSSALEWAGVFMLGVFIYARVSGLREKYYMTPDEIRAYLDEIETR